MLRWCSVVDSDVGSGVEWCDMVCDVWSVGGETRKCVFCVVEPQTNERPRA